VRERPQLSVPKKVSFSVVSLLLALGTADLVLRLTGVAKTCPNQYGESSIWVCDPILDFKLRPDLNPAGRPLNRVGFRTREFTPKKSGVYRIVTLGDSCTFGITTSTMFEYIAEPYPDRLERFVAERAGPGKVEVLNAGVPGYNSYQGVMLLRTKLRDVEADLITVRFGWNDSFMSGTVGRIFREPEGVFALALQDFLMHTELYPFVRRAELEVADWRRHFDEDTTPKAPPTEWTPNISIDGYKHNLRRIAELGRARGATVWFLTSPDAFVTDENRGQYHKFPDAPSAGFLLTFNGIPSYDRLIEIHESYNAAAREVGAELNVPVVDMAAAYRQHSSEHLFYSTDVPHPTQEGHNLEAETLFERLVAEGIVQAARRSRGG
jgi:lysophospholipase L1-like esterase